MAPALGSGRQRRWVQSSPAGVDALLTPELIAAEHVLVIASKGPMAPILAEHALLLLLALARKPSRYPLSIGLLEYLSKKRLVPPHLHLVQSKVQSPLAARQYL
jgi:hypothetical protein